MTYVPQLLAAEFVGELSLVPFLDHDDFAFVAFDDLPGNGGDIFHAAGNGAKQEHCFVLGVLFCCHNKTLKIGMRRLKDEG